MLIDYQKAWILLGDFIASKPHHGSRDLSVEMPRILARCQVPETSTEQALRLLTDQVSAPDELPDGERDSIVLADGTPPGPSPTRRPGGHDGRSPSTSSGAGEGRRAAEGPARAAA